MRGINFFRSRVLPAQSILGGSDRGGGAVALPVRAQYGLVNLVLAQFGPRAGGLAGRRAPVSLWTIVLLFTWQFGSAMVIFLAALQIVPKTLYEAAAIDGANKWQFFRYITVPLITPVIFFNLIMQTVHAFQEFNGPYIITNGRPPAAPPTCWRSTSTTRASAIFNLGYGAALSVGAVRAGRPGLAALSVLEQRATGCSTPARRTPASEVKRTPSMPSQPRTWCAPPWLLAVAVVMLYPLLWLVGATFKTNAEIFTEVGFWPTASRLRQPTPRAGRPAPNTPSPPTS
jgi:hypothetical protein